MSRLFLMSTDFPHITLMEVIWGTKLIYEKILSSSNLTHLCTLLLFFHWN